MSVVSVIEQMHKRRSTKRDGAREDVRVFKVKLSTFTEGPTVAIDASGIPLYGDAHPSLLGSLVTSVEAEAVAESGAECEVTVTYTKTIPAPRSAAILPWERPVEINWGVDEATEKYFRDRSSTPKPVTTSAGQPFENAPERDCAKRVITFTRNELTWDDTAADVYNNAENTVAVTIGGIIYPVGTLKLSPIVCVKKTETIKNEDDEDELVTYYAKNYKIKYQRDGWKDKLDDYGFAEIDPHATSKIRLILDSEKNPVSKPWPLNGSGYAKTNSTDTPAVRVFSPYNEKDISFVGDI